MSKHVIDTPGTHGNARISRYTELEKRERMHGPHRSVETVERRTRPEPSTARSKAYLKIETQSD